MGVALTTRRHHFSRAAAEDRLETMAFSANMASAGMASLILSRDEESLLERGDLRSHLEEDEEEERTIKQNAAKPSSGSCWRTAALMGVFVVPVGLMFTVPSLMMIPLGQVVVNILLGIAQMSASMWSAYEDMITLAVADPQRFLTATLSTLSGGIVMLWIFAWLLANTTSCCLRKPAAQRGCLRRTVCSALGLVSLAVYAVDVWTDVLVARLLWDMGNLVWARAVLFFVGLQYGLVHWRVCAWWDRLEPIRRNRAREHGRWMVFV